MRRVDYVYNIFDYSSSILIDGKEISKYSSLVKYISQPFEVWYKKICEAIYEEVEDYFVLYFTADSMRISIMKAVAVDCVWCREFYGKKYNNDLSIQLRMQKLNLLIKARDLNYVGRSYVLTFDAERQTERNLLKSLEIKNRFCTILMQENKENPDIHVAMCMEEMNKKQPKYGFIISDKETVAIVNNTVVFSIDENKLLEAIFQCILSDICLYALKENVKICLEQKIINENENWDLLSIEKKVEIKCDTEIELHKSKNIEFWQEGERISAGKFSFSYDIPGIISCNGLKVEGLKEGNVNLYIHYNGVSRAFQKVEFKVKKYNHVSKITLLENAVTLGVGDKKRIGLSIFPEDADNLKDEVWKSENEEIAVCNNREVVAKRKGVTRGWCHIGIVSAPIFIEVKEYLKEIQIGDRQIEMQSGTERIIEYKLFPDDAIDKDIKISSSNSMVCNVVGNCIQAKEAGQATIILESKITALKQHIQVNVIKKKRKLFWKK